MLHINIRPALSRIVKNQKFTWFVLHLSVVLVFCFSAVPVFIMLAKMHDIFSWFLAHGITNFIHVLITFFVLIMLVLGIFLGLGLALVSMGMDWYTEREYRRTRGRSDGEGINTLTDILNLLNDSITRLEGMSHDLEAQSKKLSQLCQNTEVRVSGF